MDGSDAEGSVTRWIGPLKAGEVEAALSLGLSERDSRMLVIDRPLVDALIPNLDQARTAGLVTLPGAFVGVLLATGSAVQAGAVQVLVLISLLLAQACAVAVTGELTSRGRLARAEMPPSQTGGMRKVLARRRR